MPREPRQKSRSGLYHIMLRGIDKRDIFLDKEDMQHFIRNLLRLKNDGRFELLAYCLMKNHIHLLIKEYEDIGVSVKRLAVSYVQWHNKKYARTGHLFQNRFKSEPIEDENYFLAVVRYIHQNPVKAGIVQRPEQYKWSSYGEYLLDYDRGNANVATELIKEYFKTKESFISYSNEPSKEEFLDYDAKQKYTDRELVKIINQINEIDELSKLPRKQRDKILEMIYKKTGASIRQISKVTGLGRSIVQRAIKK